MSYDVNPYRIILLNILKILKKVKSIDHLCFVGKTIFAVSLPNSHADHRLRQFSFNGGVTQKI